MKLTKKNIYISLFAVLYGGVALVSLIHAVSFFALANLLWLAILLAIIFEIGQSAVLFSILTSSTGKSKTMPWILMCILTAVQILGNVFSSYKYIVTNSPENLRFFKEPVFIWTDIPDAQATVIITYIVGGILPLVALAMSAMVTNYLENENNQKNIEVNKGEDSLINQNSILQMENQGLEESNKKKDEQIEDLKKQLESKVENLHGVENNNDQLIKEKEEEIENLNKQIEEVELDHDKMVDEKFAAEKKFNDLLEDYTEQQNEYSKLKQELEELKKSKEDDKEQEKQIENFKQVEDLIKNGVKQDKLKESHFIN